MVYVLWMDQVVFSTSLILCDGLMIAHNMKRVTNYSEGKKLLKDWIGPLCQTNIPNPATLNKEGTIII